MKRKRKLRSSSDPAVPLVKKVCEGVAESRCTTRNTHTHPVLCRYYPRVMNLRAYLLDRLPRKSKRQSKLVQKTLAKSNVDGKNTLEAHVEQLLEHVLVGCFDASPSETDNLETPKSLDCLSQALSTFNSSLSLEKGRNMEWLELIDFCIWLLFNRKHPNVWKPPHVLCHGLHRAKASYQQPAGMSAGGGCGIVGLVSAFPNEHLESLRSPAWAKIASLLSGHRNVLMMHLIMECGLFVPLAGTEGNYYQLSGTPLCDMAFLQSTPSQPRSVKNESRSELCIPRNPADIRIVRNRMYYAKAAINSKGQVFLGLRHIHVLNRFLDANDPFHTVHIMKYIFPRQFHLHNVFTSIVDKGDTTQKFKDYTLRELEIAQLSLANSVRKERNKKLGVSKLPSIPRRLRGEAYGLVRRMQKQHYGCAYKKLLDYYCPTPPTAGYTGANSSDYAIPHDQVSAFCRGVVDNVLPHAFLDRDALENTNRAELNKHIDAFVKARKFETLTLEHIMNSIKITQISWITPLSYAPAQRMSMCEIAKRKELVMELMYYIFDSLLIPLIRSSFYVTESNTHRNKMLYFRHDVWRRLVEPALVKFKFTNFEELHQKLAIELLQKRTLGFSQIRFLPKSIGMRPIENLTRRMQVGTRGAQRLTKSINFLLTPILDVLKYEKLQQPFRLGGSLFSVNDAYSKIRDFRSSLHAQGLGKSKLFFVKVDVQSCFDSIPQGNLIELIRPLLSSNEYSIAGRAEIRPPRRDSFISDQTSLQPRKIITRNADVTGLYENFPQMLVNDRFKQKDDTIFIDNVGQTLMNKDQLMGLLDEHIRSNIVKIGKKFYRQKSGIAQGSILSTMLCNLFYADFETTQLKFLKGTNNLVIRLIDDFLLITTDLECARRFFRVMYEGDMNYGLAIKPEKSLVNFDIALNEVQVPRTSNTDLFPYCGMLIDTLNLKMRRDGRAKQAGPLDNLTVEYSKNPGQSLRRKMLSRIKLHMHVMLLDTAYNGVVTVVHNIYDALKYAAIGCFQHLKSVTRPRTASDKLLLRIIEDVSKLAYAMSTTKRNLQRFPSYKCSISMSCFKWMTYQAFIEVFVVKQTNFGNFINVLRKRQTKVTIVSQERDLLKRL